MNFQHSRLALSAESWGGMRRIGAVALLSISSTSTIAGPTVYTVVIEGMKFSPSTLEVKVGDAVVWQNKDYFPHDATAENSGFRSDAIPSQGSWKFRAKKRGVFSYHCSLHPMMKAVLVVK